MQSQIRLKILGIACVAAAALVALACGSNPAATPIAPADLVPAPAHASPDPPPAVPETLTVEDAGEGGVDADPAGRGDPPGKRRAAREAPRPRPAKK